MSLTMKTSYMLIIPSNFYLSDIENNGAVSTVLSYATRMLMNNIMIEMRV